MILPSIQICIGCGIPLAIESFGISAMRKSGINTRCKLCINERAKEARLSQPGVEARRRRDWLFNLAPGRYDTLLEEQGGLCAVCRQPETLKNISLAVDHDRNCCSGNKSCGNCVRGLVCMRCNVGLPYIERKDWIDAAQEYLSKKEFN